jgi:hypothetical protein
MSRKIALLALLAAVLAGIVVPSHAQDTPPAADLITVEVGVYVVGASMFDLATAMYSVDFYVTMHCDKPCTEEDIAFDVVGLGSAEGYNVEVRQTQENYHEFRVQAQLAQNDIDLSRFPFDVHHLNIAFESKFRNTSQVMYAVREDETGLDEDVDLPGWIINPGVTKQIIAKSYYGVTDTGYARLIVSFELQRAAAASFIRDILPALVILVINFLGTFMPDRNGRIGLVGGVLLAMLVHHFSVAGTIPAVAYPVYFDSFMLLNHAVIMVQFGFTVYELVLEKRGADEARIHRISVTALAGIIIVWIIAQLAVLAVFQNITV